MTKKCSACNEVVIDIDEAICEICLESNKEVLEILKNLETFKKEFNSLFYHDVGDCWCVHPEELEFFTKRWSL